MRPFYLLIDQKVARFPCWLEGAAALAGRAGCKSVLCVRIIILVLAANGENNIMNL